MPFRAPLLSRVASLQACNILVNLAKAFIASVHSAHCLGVLMSEWNLIAVLSAAKLNSLIPPEPCLVLGFFALISSSVLRSRANP